MNIGIAKISNTMGSEAQETFDFETRKIYGKDANFINLLISVKLK